MSFRKLLKLLAYAFGGLVVLLLVATGAVYGLTQHRLTRTHPVSTTRVAVPHDSASIERGRHIAATRACADCHDADFGGRKVIDDPMAGVFHGVNITRGDGGLPADYSDDDYVRAIRHGLDRTGRALTLMPSIEYSNLSDEDLGALISYLKSLPPVNRARGPIKPGPAIRVLMAVGQIRLSAEEIDHAAQRALSVKPSTEADYGKYLAASCIGCHGPNLSGGRIPGAPPDWPAAANLTLHTSSRLGTWTEEQFMQTMRTRVRPDGSAVNPVMPAAFAAMTDTELKAIWTYLRSLPPTPIGSR